MFYSSKRDNCLRFGDVVRGFVSTRPTIKEPVLSYVQVSRDYSVSIEIPMFSVVLTPCCSIEDSLICLTPLIQLKPSFMKNPYFVEDFTIINGEIKPQKCYAPEDWDKKSLEEKEEILASSKPYTLLSMFVYEGNRIFPPYKLRSQEINYYMIDFRNVSTLKCEKIKRCDKMSGEDMKILDTKCLQLSDTAREELREKMAFYYGRPAEEEVIMSR